MKVVVFAATLVLAIAGWMLAMDASAWEAGERPEPWKVVRLDSEDGTLVLTLYEDGSGKWRME